MKKIVAIIAFLVLATGVSAAELSRNWQPWPRKVKLSAMPANAQKFLAPAGTVTGVLSASRGWIDGTNSRPMWVWATKSTSDCIVTWKYRRVVACGNPCAGCCSKNIPKESCQVQVSCCEKQPCCQPQIVPIVITPVVPQVGLSEMHYRSPAPATLDVRQSNASVVVWWQTSQTVVPPPNTCPPGGSPGNPIPVPPRPNGPQFPHYVSDGSPVH